MPYALEPCNSDTCSRRGAAASSGPTRLRIIRWLRAIASGSNQPDTMPGASYWAANTRWATVEHWHEVPELRTLWLGVIDRFTAAFASEFDRDRAAGHAPPGLPSRELAAALIWGSERTLYIAGLGVTNDLPHEDQALRA